MSLAHPVEVAKAEEIRPRTTSSIPMGDVRALTLLGDGASTATFVFPSYGVRSNVVVVTVAQTARPFAPPHLITDEPTDMSDPLEFANPWTMLGSVMLTAERMEWPQEELDY